MSSYPALGPIGQEYIQEEEYKATYGYPNGQVNKALSAEVPGTSRPFILTNQLYENEIPTTAPDLSSNIYTTSIGGQSVNYQKPINTAYSFLTYYLQVSLSNHDLAQDDSGGGLTWWFTGANIANAGSQANQVTYNILNQGVPNNLDPTGGYLPKLYINGTQYLFGNAQYPWTYNVNSGIVLFTGSSKYSGTGNPNNNTPDPSTSSITFSFWRYEGGIGIASSPWLVSGSNIYYNGGNVGIGTSTPASTLDVSGGIISYGILCKDANINPQSYLNIGTQLGANYIESFGNSLTSGSSAPLYFTNGYSANTYMSIVPNVDGSSANVGIGKPNPASTLDVSGNLQISGKIVNGLTVDGGVTINGSGSGGGAPLLNINNSGGSTRFEFADELNVFGSKPALIFEDGYGGQIVTGAPGASIEIQTTWITTDPSNNPVKSSQYAGYISIYPFDPSLGIYISGSPNNSGYPQVPIGNVGIHNTSPQYVLDVSGNARFSDVTFIGPTSNPTNTLGILKVELIGANLLVYKDASNNYTSLVNTGGNTIEIGSTSFSNNLVITGTTTSTSFNTPSDYRLKENIENLDDNYSVDNLRPVYYNNKKTKQKDIGLIAHELQEHYPFLVNGEKDGNEFQSVNYNGLIGILIKEIKELKIKVKNLEEKIY